MFQKLILVIAGLILSIYLFYKASGILKITKFNIISYTFCLFLLQTYTGVSIMFLGDREHYTVKSVMEPNSVDITFYCVLFTAIALPIVIILINKIFNINIKESYQKYFANETIVKNEKEIFIILSLFSIVCIVAMICMFIKIGYIPLFKIFFKGSGFNLSAERIIISNLPGFNQYIKNIVVLSFIPILSYLAFVYAHITKKTRWKILFFVLLFSSILVKTYNFAKTPLAFYMFTYIIIYSFINNGINVRYLIYSIFGISALILGAYLLVGLNTSIFDPHNGPIGRTIYTQAGTLIYNFDLFPKMIPFLNGKGFSNIFTRLLGLGSANLRSARILMLFYGSTHVYAGTAGVMNSFFIGEAYANFGLYGMAFSIIYIGVLFSLIQIIFLKMKKDAINLTLFSIITVQFANSTQGGFFDFIYNINIVLIIVLFLLIKYLVVFVSKNKKLSSYINTLLD